MGDNATLIRSHIRHLRNRQLRDETIRHRRLVLTRIAGELPRPLERTTLADLEDWRDAALRTMKPSSVKTYCSHVSAFFTWAHRYAGLEDNPAAELVAPRVHRGRPRPMPDDELTLALACARGQIRAMLVSAAFLGLRAGEVAKLDAAAITRTGKGYLVEVVGKGGRSRTLPCPREVVEELRPFMRGKSGPIFRDQAGRPLSAAYASVLMNRFLHGIGITSSAHTLRHAYGTSIYGLSQGDIRLVQDLLGHADPATTAGYVAASAARGAAVTDRWAQTLSRGGARRARKPRTPREADRDGWATALGEVS